jgi:hypothetical protein
MLSLSLLAGWMAGPVRDPWAAAGAAFAAICVFLAQAAWLAPPSVRRRIWLGLELGLAVPFATIALLRGGHPSGVWGGFAAATGLAALMWRRGSTNAAGRVALKAWGAHLLAAFSMGLLASWVAVCGGDGSDPVRLALALSSNFTAGVLLVRALRGGASGGDRALLLWALGVALAWCALGDAARPLALLVWIPLPLRWILARIRPGASWRALGLLETALGICMTAGAVALSRG